MTVPSQNQVKKAGSTLRKYFRGELASHEAASVALLTLEEWRRAHYGPLVSANNGLRSRAKTLGIDAEVTQRLKRSLTILDKIRREPTLDLSRMQDIGGCRAVVNDKGDLRRLEERIARSLTIVSHTDYIENPRMSGYRGIHLVVRYQGRAIEIQLRTSVMHQWALAAEHYSELLGENIKQDGDHPVQLFLTVAADMMALQEDGNPIPQEMKDLRIKRMMAAREYLVERSAGQ